MVSQDVQLFHRTVMENIRYGRPEARDEEVREAARAAYADDFIMAMPLGYERWSVSAACASPAGSASAWRLRAPSCATRRSCFWTRRPRR